MTACSSHPAGWNARWRISSPTCAASSTPHADDGWVIDGNYTALLQERRLAESDRIVILAFGRWACLRRVVSRYLRHRGRSRASMTEGCPEKLDAEFIWWILHEGRSRSHRRRFRHIRDTWPGATVVVRNQRQLNALYRAAGVWNEGEPRAVASEPDNGSRR